MFYYLYSLYKDGVLCPLLLSVQGGDPLSSSLVCTRRRFFVLISCLYKEILCLLLLSVQGGDSLSSSVVCTRGRFFVLLSCLYNEDVLCLLLLSVQGGDPLSCFLVFKTRRHLSLVLTLIQSQEGVSESCSLVFARRRCFALFSCLYNEKAPYRSCSLVFTNDQLDLVMMFFTITRSRLAAFSSHYNNGVAPTLCRNAFFLLFSWCSSGVLFFVSFFFLLTSLFVLHHVT